MLSHPIEPMHRSVSIFLILIILISVGLHQQVMLLVLPLLALITKLQGLVSVSRIGPVLIKMVKTPSLFVQSMVLVRIGRVYFQGVPTMDYIRNDPVPV